MNEQQITYIYETTENIKLVDGMFVVTCRFVKMDSAGMRRDGTRGVEVIWLPSNRRRNSLCLLCSSFRRLLS